MANAPRRPCLNFARCHNLAAGSRCATCARGRDQRRPNADVRRWYKTARWLQLRALVIQEEPLCCDCLAADRTTPTTDVDHQIPHRGDERLFWSRENLRGRCHPCHSRKTQRGE